MNALKHKICIVSKWIYEENSAKEDEFTHLLNITDYWYKDSDVLEVPYDNNLTVTYYLRMITHSIYYSDDNIFNIFGFKEDPSVEVISLENNKYQQISKVNIQYLKWK